MNILSFVALVMLTLVGYSAGAILATRNRQVMPALPDLLLVPALWVVAVLLRNGWGHWPALLGTPILAALVSAGLARIRPVGTPVEPPAPFPSARLRNYWSVWQHFTHQLGNFQGRLLMALFYFVLVTPFAIPFKLLSDPLLIRRPPTSSAWLPRADAGTDLEEMRRQF